ncbi:MAG: hypothetical protein ACMUJM_00575 [bacterium]
MQGHRTKKLSVILALFLFSSFFFSHYLWAIGIVPGDGEIKVSWSPPTKNEDGTLLTDLAGYNVYRAEERGEFIKINNELVKNIIFTDQSVVNGHLYYYKITAVDSSGNESRYSEHISAIPRVQPPDGFNAKPQDGYVELFWQSYKKSPLSAFKIYKSRTPRGADDLEPGKSQEYAIETVELDPESHYYKDENVGNGINYFYSITSVNKNGQESQFSPERGVTPLASIPFMPSGVTARYEMGKVVLFWEAVEDVIGYNIYRRQLDEGHTKGMNYTKLNSHTLLTTEYRDEDVTENQVYFYSIVGINKGGMESSYPLEVECRTSSVYISSFTHNGGVNPLKNGDVVVFTLFGTPSCNARVRIESLNKEIPLEEIEEGEYHSSMEINETQSITDAAVTAYLTDNKNNIISWTAQQTIDIDTSIPPQVVGGEATWEEKSKSIKIRWQSPLGESSSPDEFSYFDIYRSSNSTFEDPTHIARIAKEENRYEFNDYSYKKGNVYYYALEVVDNAGNRSPRFILNKEPIHPSPEDFSGPDITSLHENTGGLTQKTGDTIRVTMLGEPGCSATFSLAINTENEISMKEEEPGLYRGEYRVQSSDSTMKTLIIGTLKYDDDHISIERTKTFFAINAARDDTSPPHIEVAESNYNLVVGFSGTLVGGDTLTLTCQGDPECAASFIIADKEIRDISEFLLHEPKYIMQEIEPGSGSYQGKYTVEKHEDISSGFAYIALSDLAGNKSLAHINEPLTIDTRSRISVEIHEREFLVSDGGATGIIANVKNANGDPIEGHDIVFDITTTDEYTGMVGAGEVEIDGSLETDSFGGISDREKVVKSDRDGVVEARYTAGAAAKTAIVLAKDLSSGSVGVNYIINRIEAETIITLIPVGRARYRAANQYKIIVSADPDRITADGVSISRIVAQLADLNNQPVKVAGCVISFSLHAVEGMDDQGGFILEAPAIGGMNNAAVTDNEGQAVINYQAGIRRGQVKITATVDKVDSPALNKYLKATGSTHITLMSDAPAKIYVSADPQTVPADGRSRSKIGVKITDLNDNPVQNAMVEYNIIKGIGSLMCRSVATDNNGQAQCEYIPGRIAESSFNSDDLSVLIRMGVSSRVPSADELAKAGGTIFIPLLYPDFGEHDEVKIVQWLKRENGTIEKNEPLVQVKAPDGRYYMINAAVSGILTDIRAHKLDNALLGQTIGIIKSDDNGNLSQ